MTLPISAEFAQQLTTLSPTQLAWLSGYAWAQSQGVANAVTVLPDAAAIPPQSTLPDRRVMILSASQTGNARRVAEELLVRLDRVGIPAQLTAAGDFKSKSLVDEDIVLLVTSTQGEGEPPEEALPLHKFLFGKKTPDLSRIHFAVLGLGDSSYPNFCQAAKDFDAQLAALGGHRVLARVDCDADYQKSANAWLDTVTAAVSEMAAQNGNAAPSPTPAIAPEQRFTKTAPFSATLSVRQKITARQANKDIEHIEIDLADSGIVYRPGDALGVYYRNDPALVDEILQHTQVDRNTAVRLADGREVSIATALSEELDITQNTPALVKTYAAHANEAALNDIAADTAALADYIAGTPPVGVFAAYPQLLTAQALHDLFRPLTPRLYSISSAQDEVGAEVHLTIGVARFVHHNITYTGGASGYLGARLVEGEEVRVFVEENPYFRLPENGHTPIIMIGAGTGIAPFRAFMQQRAANGDDGDNWLVFGNQKFTDDFLYQTEWLQYRKSGLLDRYDFAWSREGSEKVYVQHKLREKAAEIWTWLQRGAHVYVCGDAGRMARDVEQALLDIIATHGGMSADDADDYLNDLRENKRYQRDVY